MPGLRCRTSELKEQIQNDTNTRMTWTSGNSISSVDSQMVLRGGGGKLGCRCQTVSPCLGCLEGKEMEGSAAEKQWGRKIYWSLSPFPHLFPPPSAALAKLPDEFSYSQLLAFFLWSHTVLWSQVASLVPLCFPSAKHIIKTYSFQKVIYTLISLHIKYLGIFKGKQ